jgi:hypothetical protein
MKLQTKTVAKIVKGWSLMFPGQRDPGQLVFLSGQFYEALQHRFTDEGFILAANIIRDEQEYFPTVAAVAKLSNIVAEKISRNKQIGQNVNLLTEEADNLSQEEIEQNKEKVAIITKMLAGQMTIAEAVEEQNKLTSWSQYMEGNIQVDRGETKPVLDLRQDG